VELVSLFLVESVALVSRCAPLTAGFAGGRVSPDLMWIESIGAAPVSSVRAEPAHPAAASRASPLRYAVA
jgi:hypothetical protein